MMIFSSIKLRSILFRVFLLSAVQQIRNLLNKNECTLISTIEYKRIQQLFEIHTTKSSLFRFLFCFFGKGLVVISFVNLGLSSDMCNIESRPKTPSII